MKKILFGFLKVIGFFGRIRGMVSRKSEEDVYAERVTDGRSWAEFCDHLKAAGASLMYLGAPRDAAQQAEGIRYLSRLTRAALEAFVEYNDPKFPAFRRTVHETIKMGADNPDNYYLNAQISGQYEYLVTGRRNTIHYFGMFTQNGNYGTTGGLSPCGVLEDGDLVVNDDGTFEVVLSKERRGQNWLKIEEDTSLLMIRQTFYDRASEQPVSLSIKAIGVNDRPAPITPRQIDDGLSTAGMFVGGASLLFARWAKDFRKHTNQLPMFDPATSNAAGGDANIIYYHSHWQLAPGQALIVEVVPPECDDWNFQLNNYWMESLDYLNYRVCINRFSAVPNPDGSITVIVAHDDPGHPNWIETAGHCEGTMCWRWYRPKGKVPDVIGTRVIDVATLKTELT